MSELFGVARNSRFVCEAAIQYRSSEMTDRQGVERRENTRVKGKAKVSAPVSLLTLRVRGASVQTRHSP